MGNFSGKAENEQQQPSNGNSTQSQQQSAQQPQQSSEPSKKSKGRYKVELAASVLGGSGPFTAYHTSVVIDGTEYFFDMAGVMSSSSMMSHQGKQQYQKIEIGYTNKSGSSLERTLRPYFGGGSYDLLRKNCNSFSDCALWYLCRERLPASYNRMEKLGNSEMLGSLVQSGQYQPNPKADDFDKEKVIDACKDVFEKTEGLTLGGQNVQSKDDMKAKRLAMLEKNMGIK
eukprot:CAMPEP_0197022784 /NCGR_PEP_ID=MMETSP1384-20130603/3599_1 /TAXON_ID=29189 /ORGANISM="Ammonia sp." /LENGTH=228 /DNA_ID=CAMNT_0042450887 /DNA_START=23 /DNA_END=709 /DNA_ORIENTATION=+